MSSTLSDLRGELEVFKFADIESVSSGEVFKERLTLSSSSGFVINRTGAPSKALAEVDRSCGPFAFLDERKMGSDSDSVGLALFDEEESVREHSAALADTINCSEFVVKIGFSKTRIDPGEIKAKYSQISVIGRRSNALICSCLNGDFPKIFLMDSEVICIPEFSADDIEFSWCDIGEFAEWFLADTVESVGSSWRYIDQMQRQFALRRLY